MVGAVATVVVPAAIGVVCAATGVGLVATIALGAVAGAAIASTTAAASTIQQDGKIDWETVGVCAGVGAVVGAVVSGVSYGITKLVQGASSTKAAVAAAAVAGSWIKDSSIGLVGYGGSGGYNHFHDLARTIHILVWLCGLMEINMEFNQLKNEIIEILEENHIKIRKVIAENEDVYMVHLSSENDESGNCISIRLENSVRFGLSAALYASEEYYFEGDNILNQINQKIKEEIRDLKYFNVYGKNGCLISSNVFIEEKWDKKKVIQILENNFIFDKNDKPELIIVSNFNGDINFQVNLKDENELKIQSRE